MKKVFQKILTLIFALLILLSYKNVFSEGFNYYIDGIKESSVTENNTGACKNVCGAGYYQLTFGLPITKMSRCACVPLSQGVGALIVGFTQFLLSSIGVLAVILIIVAGFMRAFSAGNAEVIKRTNTIMKNAFIGVIAVIFSGSVLAIVNPDLVNTGIFETRIAKIDVPCVDSKMAMFDNDGDDKKYTRSDDKKIFVINCVGECKNNLCSALVVGAVETKNGISEKIMSTTIDSSSASNSCECVGDMVQSDRIPSCLDELECKKNTEVCMATLLVETLYDGVTFHEWKCFPKLDAEKPCYQNLECKSGRCKNNGNVTKQIEVIDDGGKKQRVQTAGGYCQ